MKRYLFASDFGKTLTSNDTGYVVSELLAGGEVRDLLAVSM
jgi:hypothetical protein